MSTPTRYLSDAYRELSMAQTDLFDILLNFNAKRPGDSAIDIAQAKRRLARATAALTMLENTIPAPAFPETSLPSR